jgi:hypothetical protein
MTGISRDAGRESLDEGTDRQARSVDGISICGKAPTNSSPVSGGTPNHDHPARIRARITDRGGTTEPVSSELIWIPRERVMIARVIAICREMLA